MNILKQHIKQKKFSQVYLLYGEEDYLRKMYRDSLKSSIIADDLTMNYSYYEGDSIDVNEVIAQAGTMPFFSDKRLIIIENSRFFDSQNPLADYLNNLPDSTYIIFVQVKVDKRSRLYKRINKLGTTTEFKELDAEKLRVFIASILNKDNKRITTNNANYLLDIIGTDMVNIRNEVEKLISYAYDRDSITKKDIDAVCTERIESKVFQMIDALVVGDKNKALNLYYDLLELKESPFSIIFLIGRHLKILIKVKDLNKSGNSKQVIASKAGINSYFLGKYMGQAKKFSMDTLKASLLLCNETEEAIKTGRSTDQLGVEVLIIQLANL